MPELDAGPSPAVPVPDTKIRSAIRTVAAMALAVLLAYSGYVKFADSADVTQGAHGASLRAIAYRLPEVIQSFTLGMALLECIVCVLLVLPKSRRVGAALTLGLSFVWITAVMHLQALGADPAACGCFAAKVHLTYVQHYGLIGAVAAIAVSVL